MSKISCDQTAGSWPRRESAVSMGGVSPNETSVLQDRFIAGQNAQLVGIVCTMKKPRKFDSSRITGALEGSLSPDELSSAEQEVWFDQFATMMAVPSKQEKDSHVQRQKRGRGVGMASSGEIVHEKHEG